MTAAVDRSRAGSVTSKTVSESGMSREPSSLRRTEWAERHVEDFMALPLVREFVFRSPLSLDREVQKEVVDFLIAHGETAILVSQKCQEDPSARTGAKVASWARKAARGAASQLRGALRRTDGKPVWCEHSRRGRVQFPNGLPKIDHAIVVVEVFERVDLEPDAAHLPLEFQGTPITYLSLNDFLNLAVNLRTSSELLEYLNVRRVLPPSDLRVIGDDRSLFESYLLGGPSLHGARSREEAAAAVARQRDRLMEAITAKRESDRYSSLLEHVADELATRLPDYATDIPEPLLAHFEPSDARVGYMKMQGILAGLRLRERAELGQAFDGV
jgi:dsDNA-binding SOS-regulon protein